VLLSAGFSIRTTARSRRNHRPVGKRIPVSDDSAESVSVGAVEQLLHAEAARAEDTDWPQILALATSRTHLAEPNGHAQAPSRSRCCKRPQAGLDLLRTLNDNERIAEHHRLHAIRAHLLELTGDRAAAQRSYQAAARRTTSLPEQRYLEARAARLIDEQ
jgi:predicted RNA polymerase sigma factor